MLCGGLGTRISPLSDRIPKSLIEVAGKPFIYHQFNLLSSNGFKKIIICAGHYGDQIVEFVGSGSKWGLDVSYSFDGNDKIGTGGALLKASKLLENFFFVMYGDSYLPINYLSMLDAFYKSNTLGLMAVYKNYNKKDRSNVMFYKDSKCIYYSKKIPSPKMKFIDYGVSILDKKILKKYENENKFDLSIVLENASNSGQLMGYEVFNQFYEIGSFEGINDINKYFKESK